MNLHGKTVGVVGTGAIGSSLALLCALRGANVVTCGRSASSLERCREQVSSNLELLETEQLVAPRRMKECSSRMDWQIGWDSGLANAQAVFEAVAEDIVVKRDLVTMLGNAVDSKCLIASCTSGLPADEIFSDVAAPERTVIMHFANPPLLMPAVEIVPGTRTSSTTMARAADFTALLGKEPVILKSDTPGHLFNRIQFAMLREAMSLVTKGIATAEQVDKVVKLGLALRLPAEGPLEKIDLAGLQLVESVASYIYPVLDRSLEPDYLRDLISRGRLGADWGAGIYDWTTETRDRAIEARARQVIGQLRMTGKTPDFS